MSENAITKKEGPCIIFAGAGTGKTYTIIEKLKYLIGEKIYAPERIICLTFSNEAANTLKVRLQAALPTEGEPVIRTFHALCADLLKAYGSSIGVKSNFKILIPDEAKVMLHKNLKINPNLCSKYTEAIGVAKDLGITPEAVLAYLERNKKKEYSDDLQKSVEMAQFELNTQHATKKTYGRNEIEERRERLKRLTTLLKIQKFVRAWVAYEKIKEKRGFLDYADLNTKALALLASYPKLAENYDYIIVDEFQDTNKLQFDLLVALAPHRNVTVVGDVNQSIYRFRGAYKENITAFKEHFKVQPSDVYTLEKSFRSPNTILRVANRLVTKEPLAFALTNAFNREGEKVKAIELKNDKEETRKVVEIIKEEQEKGTPLEEICVMFRTHSQSQRLKRTLEEHQIPFAAATKVSLLDKDPIEQILNHVSIAYYRVTKKRGGEHKWWSVFHAQGLSKEDLALLGREIKKREESSCISEELLEALETKEMSEKAKTYTAGLKKILLELQKALEEKKSLVEIMDLAYKQVQREANSTDRETAYAHFKEWLADYLATESQEVGDFLYHIDVMKKLGIMLEPKRTEQKGIRIMTNHATKGLEYTVVIITNMAQGRFPTERPRSNDMIPAEIMPDIAAQIKDVPDYAREEIIEQSERAATLAEERRLAYVACTRAKQQLYLTFAREYGSRSYGPSQFLTELDYTKNQDIEFTQDLEEKDMQNAPQITTAEAMLESTKPRKRSFSPSALLLFNDCQKKYEYKYIYHMPEKEPASWEEMRLGSFIHKVIEEGIKRGFTTEEAFLSHARSTYIEDEWNQINLDEALNLLRIFYQRNKNKYTKDSLTEIKLRAELGGVVFEGYADRIDVHPEGLEIIDYKTGKAFLTAKHRNWQLGIYALAAQELGLGPVKKMTLDMLRHERPAEFELLADGTARDVNAPRITFNLEQVKNELIATAHTILECYKKGFQPCDLEDNCEFCNEFIWKV